MKSRSKSAQYSALGRVLLVALALTAVTAHSSVAQDLPNIVLINGLTADWMSLGPELYNVLDDPREAKNLIRERPGIAEELRALLDKWWPVGR